MNYQMIYLPIIALILCQIIKMIINGIKAKFSWKDLNSYGGMPSSHTALVVALSAAVGHYAGWHSAAFAVSCCFAILIVRDAVGFRRILGLHAGELNQLASHLQPGLAMEYPHQVERLGHTPLQALFGALVGLAVVIGYIVIF